jgi:hypothetical protein
MLQYLRTRSKKDNSKQSRMSQKSRDGGSESDISISDNEKHASLCTNSRDTQECDRCHNVGHIAQHCPCTPPVQSRAPTETEAAAATAATTMTTTSIVNNWMTVTNRESRSKGS